MGTMRIDGFLRIILGILFSMVLSHASWAGDVAVLVDISGSLKNMPVQEGRRLLSDLLLKGQIPPSWEVVRADEENSTVKSLTAGPHKPLIQPGDHLLLMTFGSKRNDNFPYFRNPDLFKVGSLDDVGRRLARYYPLRHEVKEAYTFYELALAVAADLLKENGASQSYLIVLSDFQESQSHEQPLTTEQANRAAAFRQSKDQKEVLSIVHKERKLLQARIYNMRFQQPQQQPPKKEEPSPPPPPETQEIKLIAPRGEIKETRPTFKWSGLPDAEFYILRCQGDKGVIKERAQQSQFQPQKDLPSGEYTWQVIAHLPGDQTVISDKGKFKVKSSSPGWLLVFLLGLSGVVAGIYYRKQLLAWLGFPTKKTGVS